MGRWSAWFVLPRKITVATGIAVLKSGIAANISCTSLASCPHHGLFVACDIVGLEHKVIRQQNVSDDDVVD